MLSYTLYLHGKGDQLSWYDVMSQVSPYHDHCDKETLGTLYFITFQSFRPIATIQQYTYLWWYESLQCQINYLKMSKMLMFTFFDMLLAV